MASTETTEELYTVIKNDPACLVFHNKTPAFLLIPATLAFFALCAVGAVQMWHSYQGDWATYILNQLLPILTVLLFLSLVTYAYNRYEILLISPIGVAQRTMIVGKTAIR